jgi:NADPH2:quinone reductase
MVERYGTPSVLRLKQIAEPQPGPGEVAISVAYAGVNYAEVMARRGELPAFQPPFVPGLEVSGHVCGIGPGVTGFAPGQRVIALTTRGGYAEVAIAPAVLAFTLPLDGEGALMRSAPLPTIVPTAWAIIHELAHLRAGEDILVQAAAGGVGTIAGQLARLAGAGKVFGVASTAEKAAYADRFGYDEVFVGPNWPREVAERTAGRGVDVVLDSIGGETRRRGFEALAPLGRIVFFGNASGDPEEGFRGGALRAEVKSTLGWSITALAARDAQRVRRIAERAFGLVASGAVQVDVTKTFTLDQVAGAHELLEARASTGKLLIEVGGGRP